MKAKNKLDLENELSNMGEVFYQRHKKLLDIVEYYHYNSEGYERLSKVITTLFYRCVNIQNAIAKIRSVKPSFDSGCVSIGGIVGEGSEEIIINKNDKIIAEPTNFSFKVGNETTEKILKSCTAYEKTCQINVAVKEAHKGLVDALHVLEINTLSGLVAKDVADTLRKISKTKYKCIKSFTLTGKGELFTEGLIYVSEHKNCLTNNYRVNTIVMNNQLFNFDEYFE